MSNSKGAEEIKLVTSSEEVILRAASYSDEFVSRLNKSQNLATVLHANQAPEGPKSDRHKLACAHFLIALDHHTAVIVLIRVGLRSAALALVRSIWETYLRGLWAACIADDQRISDFLSGRNPPTLNTVLKSLKKNFKDKSPARYNYIDGFHAVYDELNEYAHGGPLQIKNWISDSSLEASHAEPVMAEWLDFVDQVAMYAAFDLDLVAGFNGVKIDDIMRQWQP